MSTWPFSVFFLLCQNANSGEMVTPRTHFEVCRCMSAVELKIHPHLIRTAHLPLSLSVLSTGCPLLEPCLPFSLMCLFCIYPVRWVQKVFSWSKYLLRTLMFLCLEKGGRNPQSRGWHEEKGYRLKGVKKRSPTREKQISGRKLNRTVSF